MSVEISVALCIIGAALGILIATGVIPLFREPPVISKKKLIGSPPSTKRIRRVASPNRARALRD